MRSLVALCLVLSCSADLLSHVGRPAVVQSVVADGDDTVPADVTRLSVTELTGVRYLHGVPSFSFPAAVPVNTEVDSDEITTAVHGIPYTFPSFAAAVPAFSVPATRVETTNVQIIDADVPADTSKLAITPQQQEVSIPNFNYVQPTFRNIFSHNNFPYNNFGYNNFGHSFYNHHNPLTYSSAGYPHHFGFPYNFGYNWAPTTYAAAAPVEVEDSSFEEDD